MNELVCMNNNSVFVQVVFSLVYVHGLRWLKSAPRTSVGTRAVQHAKQWKGCLGVLVSLVLLCPGPTTLVHEPVTDQSLTRFFLLPSS